MINMEMLPATKLHATPQSGAVSAPLIDVREVSDVERIGSCKVPGICLCMFEDLVTLNFVLSIYTTQKLLHTDQRHVHMCSVRSKG